MRHLKLHLSNMYSCSNCNRNFSSEQEKIEHIKEKHPKKMCETCGKQFARVRELNTHLKMHDDTFVPQFVCKFDGCRKSFETRTRYEDHLNIHTGAMPFKCPNCSKPFRCRYARNFHHKVCTGKYNAVMCNECGQTFNHTASLHNHKMAKHSERHFMCNCGAFYQYLSGLHRHQKRTHHQ